MKMSGWHPFELEERRFVTVSLDTTRNRAAGVLRRNDAATLHDSGPSMPGHGEQPGWQP